MQITIDTSVPLSSEDALLLEMLIESCRDDVKVVEVGSGGAGSGRPPRAPEEFNEPVGVTRRSLKDAVARATELVAEQKTDIVKAALEAAGAARVSELTGDQVDKFLGFLDE